jgi:hypothetical protein
MNPSRARCLLLVAISACTGAPRAIPTQPPPPERAPPATSAVVPMAAAQPPVPALRSASFAEIATPAEKRCDELHEEDQDLTTTSGLKRHHAYTNECLQRRMLAELDAVLLPAQREAPARLQALRKEQADFNRFTVAFADLVEKKAGTDLDAGTVLYGSCYDCGQLACTTSATLERLYYAVALRAGAIAGLTARIEEQQAVGVKTRGGVRAIARAAARWQASPGGPEVAGATWWKEMADGAAEVERRAATLAASTCAGWPELGEALGGGEACRKKVATYYLGSCSFLP